MEDSRSYQGLQTLWEVENAWNGRGILRMSNEPVCVCVHAGVEGRQGDGVTEAGRGKKPRMSPEDVGWHQIILGRVMPDQMTLGSIFNENNL